MLSQIRSACAIFLALSVITGLGYPLFVTAVAQAAFPQQARGSLIFKNGTAVGSSLVGQNFDDPKYVWGRLSATLDANGKALPNNAASSVGSNLGPTNSALIDEVKARIDALHAADPTNDAPIPVDLVTSSGSGLDPDITPAAAEYQVGRVARTRKLPASRVRALVADATSGRELGILGEPRVNVLKLNLALDSTAE